MLAVCDQEKFAVQAEAIGELNKLHSIMITKRFFFMTISFGIIKMFAMISGFLFGVVKVFTIFTDNVSMLFVALL